MCNSKRNFNLRAGKIILRLLFMSTFSILACYGFMLQRAASRYHQSSYISNTRNPLKISPSMDNSNDIQVHHMAIKTRNITLAIQFYSLLGFEPAARFKAGSAKAAWLEQKQVSPTNQTSPPSRIELIEVPTYVLREPEGMKRRAFDLFKHQEYLGHNHFALDVTKIISNSNLDTASPSSSRNNNFLLSRWMELLNKKSLKLFRKSLRIALEAEQFMVGNIVWERAFIYDADGALIELLRKTAELQQQIDPMSGWEQYYGPWFGVEDVDAGNDESII